MDTISDIITFDPDAYYLGAVCKEGHRWEWTNQTLRYRSTRQCVVCLSVLNKQRSPSYLDDYSFVLLVQSSVCIRAQVAVRLWVKAEIGEPDECWLWRGPATKTQCAALKVCIDGYQKVISPPRIAFLLAYNFLPASPLVVRHKVCGNFLCCNASHMEEGTQQDNMDDRERHGHTARGERSGARLHPEKWRKGEEHWNAYLTADLVREIHRLHEEGFSYTQIAQKIGTTKSNVGKIVTRESWPHIK